MIYGKRSVVTVRGVVPGDVGGAMAPTDFGRSVNQGGRLCPPNYYFPPRIFTPSYGPTHLKETVTE